MRAHTHTCREGLDLPITLAWYSKHECNVHGLFFSLFTMHVKQTFDGQTRWPEALDLA